FHADEGRISQAGQRSVPPARTYFSPIFSEYVSGPRSIDTLLRFFSQVRTVRRIGSVRLTRSPSAQARSRRRKPRGRARSSRSFPVTFSTGLWHQPGTRR